MNSHRLLASALVVGTLAAGYVGHIRTDAKRTTLDAGMMLGGSTAVATTDRSVSRAAVPRVDGPELAAASSSSISVPRAVTAPAAQQSYADINAPYDAKYHFVRVRYDVGGGGFGGFGGRRGGGREPSWAHDYPRAERNFLKIIDETTYVVPQTEGSNVLTLDDPELFKYPIAYIVEVGRWNPTDEEVASLGEYLLKGGFLIVDDTRDERGNEWANFAYHMERALPGLALVPLDHEHDIFDSFFEVDPAAVVPPYGPRIAEYYAIFEDNDPDRRILVLFNFNNDIAEYWEYSDMGYFPIDLSNEAYKLGVNYIVYALTH